MKTIRSQFLFDLADIYHAEHRIATALPKMTKADTSDELKRAILSLAKEAEGHMIKVEQIFQCFGRKPLGRSLEQQAAEDEFEPEYAGSLATAAALISALRQVNCPQTGPVGCQREWEIASYGCLNEWANLLGNSEAADLLEEILEEETAAKRSADSGDFNERKAM